MVYGGKECILFHSHPCIAQVSFRGHRNFRRASHSPFLNSFLPSQLPPYLPFSLSWLAFFLPSFSSFPPSFQSFIFSLPPPSNPSSLPPFLPSSLLSIIDWYIWMVSVDLLAAVSFHLLWIHARMLLIPVQSVTVNLVYTRDFEQYAIQMSKIYVYTYISDENEL